MRSNVKSPDKDNRPTSNALNLKKKQKTILIWENWQNLPIGSSSTGKYA